MSVERSLRDNLWYVVATVAILAGLALLAQNVSASVGRVDRGDRESLPTGKTHVSNVAVVPVDTDTPTGTLTDTPTYTGTPTVTPTNTPTNTPGALLVGHVIRQSSRGIVVHPISLTLTMSSTQINYFPYTDASGFFTVSVDSLAPGTYGYRARGVHYLSNAGTVTLTGAPITSFDIGTLRNGDSNNDEIVDMMDFVILKAAFGASCGSPNYDPRADYDDSCNVTDFNGFKNWYCWLGAPPIPPPPTPNGDAFTVLQPNTSLPGTCPAPANGGTTTVGCTFALDLMVNAGSRTDVAAQQTNLTFTYQLIQNARVSSIGTSCVPTSTVTGDQTLFDTNLGNEVCNNQPGGCIFRGRHADNGSIDYHSGALVNCGTGCGGTFRVAQIGLCALAPGQVVLHWQFSPPFPRYLHSDIVNVNANLVQDQSLYTDYVFTVLAPTATPTRTPTPLPRLVGHVTIEGRPAQPNALQSVPVTFTLKVSAGGPEYNYTTNTDASGFFTITSPAGAGLYNWRVKNPQTLATSGSVTLPSSGTTQQEMGLLREGDANNDNCTSALDFNIVRNSFGKGVGDPGYDSRADFNGDQTINITDFNLVKGSFGQCGAGPIRPAP